VIHACVDRTLYELFDRTVAERGPEPAVRSEDRSWLLTWNEYAEQARAVARGLSGLGIGRGDTVACWLRDRPALHLVGAGALRLGAVPFSLHHRYTANQIEHAIADAASRVLVTEPAFFHAALGVRDARRTALQMIVLVEGADARALTWPELLECAPADLDLEAVAAPPGPDDVATLVYARGVSGPPTGIRLTHRQVISLMAWLRTTTQEPA
jgi:long-chain acyl-CoA synthetase